MNIPKGYVIVEHDFKTKFGAKIKGICRKGTGLDGTTTDYTTDFNEIQAIAVIDAYGFAEVVRDGDTVIDIGCHIGGVPLLLGSAGRNITTYCFEPLQSNYEILLEHIKLNDLKRVHAFHRAVAPGKEIDIYKSTDSTHRFIGGIHTGGEGQGEKETVPCISLNDILRDNGIGTCIIKIDCEGCEHDVFRTLDPALLNRIRYVLGEHHNMKREDFLTNFPGFVEERCAHMSDTPIGHFRFRNPNVGKGVPTPDISSGDGVPSYPGHYQDLPGSQGIRAVRPTDVWGVIRPHIPPGSVVLDFGADMGYFSRQIATEIPESLVLSVESHGRACDINEFYARRDTINNLIIAQYQMSLDDIKNWNCSVETIDVLLLLNIIHTWGEETQRQYLKAFSELIPTLIIEFPYPEFKGSKIESLLREFYDEVEVLGDIPGVRTDRLCVAKKNRIERKDLNSVFEKNNITFENRKKVHRLHWNRKENKWILYTMHGSGELWNRELVRGLSLFALEQFNVTYPETEWWASGVRQAYEELFKAGQTISNINLPNVIVTSHGMKPIDWEYGGVEGPDMVEKLVEAIRSSRLG